MACTTILVGKAASYDGSTMIARNDDSGSGHFTAKKFTVIHPEELPKIYRSVLSHAEIPLPEGALRFTAMPNAVEGKGIWAASGVNAANTDLDGTAALCEEQGVVAKAAIAKKALPNCNIVCLTGEELKADVSGYLQVLYDADPAAVGGTLPGEDFYWAAQ